MSSSFGKRGRPKVAAIQSLFFYCYAWLRLIQIDQKQRGASERKTVVDPPERFGGGRDEG
jgi:hypothetical protein